MFRHAVEGDRMVIFSCNFCIKCEHTSLGSLEILRLRGIEDPGCTVVF